MKKIAVFDIDGTIFRSSLVIELTEALIQAGVFPADASKPYARTYKRWLDRKGSYQNYIDDVVVAFEKNIKGVSCSKFSKVARKVVSFHKNRTYRYTRDLVISLKKKNYYLLAISNSPERVVRGFSKNMGFDKIYGQMHEISKENKFTGKRLYENNIKNKEKILKRTIEKEEVTLKGSIGVGDTDSDIPFLKMVERPICFNPDKKLYRYAKSVGWEIVIERKNVIYHL